ncbi:MAG: glycosyl hydrolase, repeat, partial [Rhodospirillales bacterium]|nr:glycosyl hydrolase, repeat [Rhodospirillales bacterium]
MSNILHVATRKGLITFKRAGAAWTASPPTFIGQPVSAVLTDPRDGAVYAALRLGHFGVKLHRSDDHGATWSEIAAPAFPAVETPDEKAPAV